MKKIYSKTNLGGESLGPHDGIEILYGVYCGLGLKGISAVHDGTYFYHIAFHHTYCATGTNETTVEPTTTEASQLATTTWGGYLM